MPDNIVYLPARVPTLIVVQSDSSDPLDFHRKVAELKEAFAASGIRGAKIILPDNGRDTRDKLSLPETNG